MPRKNTVTLGSLLKSTTSLFNETKDHHIPSIVEFVESPMYLGIKSLYPIQKLILKAFYRGSRGNEDMVLTPEEEALCVQHGLISAKNGDVLGKVKSGELFKELVLVWGRRSGKDFCISIIALYEAMRLLESPGGDPYKVYNLGSAAPFTILTIANSANQAKILFNEIRNKFLASPYFRDKFINEGITTDSIHLLTPKNKEENERWAAKGIAPFAGSVVIQAGHSNSNALVGLSCFVLLLDEVGLYKQTGGASSGDQIYHNLSPTTRTYVRAETVKDENGNLVTKRYYDGKIIAISSPRGMDGIFYELYKKADTISNRLMCRLPTWVVNISHTEQSLRDQEQQMTEEKFMMEYGAEFSGTEGENFFTADLVECCFKNHNFRMAEHGEMGITYFAHLDPALSNHNYALVLLHKHMFLNKDTKKYDFIIVVDHVKLWTPIKGKPIRLGEVDERSESVV